MKYLRKFNESIDSDYENEVRLICEKYNITNYNIDENGYVNVYDYVNLSQQRLTKLPLKFGIVDNSFDCDSNRLTSLEGSPLEVTGYFDCGSNLLTSLVGGPSKVGEDYVCGSNQLTSLEGAPVSIGGSLYCRANQITTLNGCPEDVEAIFCPHNPIEKWWLKVNDIKKLEVFLELDIDSNDPDDVNEMKIRDIIE